MKRSNLYLLILAGVLLVCFLVIRFSPRPRPIIYGFSEPVKVLSIMNTELQAKDIQVDPAIAPHSRGEKKREEKKKSNGIFYTSVNSTTLDDSTYLYYAIWKDSTAIRKHTPAAWLYNDTLDVGGVKGLAPGEHSVLKLRIDGLRTILLNGKPVWEAPYAN